MAIADNKPLMVSLSVAGIAIGLIVIIVTISKGCAQRKQINESIEWMDYEREMMEKGQNP